MSKQRRKFVIGFELPTGQVEIDTTTSDGITDIKEYFAEHFKDFHNAKIYELVEKLK